MGHRRFHYPISILTPRNPQRAFSTHRKKSLTSNSNLICDHSCWPECDTDFNWHNNLTLRHHSHGLHSTLRVKSIKYVIDVQYRHPATHIDRRNVTKKIQLEVIFQNYVFDPKIDQKGRKMGRKTALTQRWHVTTYFDHNLILISTGIVL